MDGVGEWATSSFGIGEGNEINIIADIQFPDSLGLLYSAFTYYTGFRVNSGEYKVMGLAPYHNSKKTIEVEEVLNNMQSIDGIEFSFNSDVKDIKFSDVTMHETTLH